MNYMKDKTTEAKLLELAISTRLEYIWRQSENASEKRDLDTCEVFHNEYYAWREYCNKYNIQLPNYITERF